MAEWKRRHQWNIGVRTFNVWETEDGGFYGPGGPEEHEELLRLVERVRELEAENLALVAVIGNIANAAVDSAVRGMKEG